MGRKVKGKTGFSKNDLRTGRSNLAKKSEIFGKISKSGLRTSGTESSLGKNPKKKTHFRKRDLESLPNGDLIVNKGEKSWDWQITIPKLALFVPPILTKEEKKELKELKKIKLKLTPEDKEQLKKLNEKDKQPPARAVDYTKEENLDRLILTEKTEVANVLEKLNLRNTMIHNLGGNPFSPAERVTVKHESAKVDKVRRETREIKWRLDKEAGRRFIYPITSEDTEVLIIADDDFIGSYLSQNLAHAITSKNIRIMNSESNQPETIKDIVFDRPAGKKFAHSDNNYIGASWFIGSQAEIGATLSSAFQINGTLFDTFTADFRPNDLSWSEFKANYLRQFQRPAFNIADQEFAIIGEVLRNEKANKIRIKATVQTDLGLREVVGESDIDVQDFNSKIFDVRISEKERNRLNVRNTDDTVLILADQLGINTSQGELIIQRLSSQGLITYPRTEFEGISQKEDITATKLADTWLSYRPEFKNERKDIIKGINDLKDLSGEIPRSGIFVLNKTNFKENTIEKKVLDEIAEANILASLGAYEVIGKLEIINKETNEPIEMIDSSEVSIITRKKDSVGKVILVETERKEGLTDRELFRFMSKDRKPDSKDSTLGTVSSRNRLVDRLKSWQLILENPKGELKTDDKAKLMILLADKAVENNKTIPSLTTGEFTKFTRDQRKEVANDPDLYQERKELLYQHLADLNKTFYNKKAHVAIESEFNELSKQIDLSRKIETDLRNDSVQIV